MLVNAKVTPSVSHEVTAAASAPRFLLVMPPKLAADAPTRPKVARPTRSATERRGLRTRAMRCSRNLLTVHCWGRNVHGIWPVHHNLLRRSSMDRSRCFLQVHIGNGREVVKAQRPDSSPKALGNSPPTSWHRMRFLSFRSGLSARCRQNSRADGRADRMAVE